MSNDLTLQKDFNSEQIELIKSTVAKGSTDNELKLFLYQAQRTGLDPLAKQIYFVIRGYGEKRQVTIQTSIDGFRVIAERSGVYAGQDEPVFEKCQTFEGKPDFKCSINIYKFNPKTGERFLAAVGVAYMSESRPPAGQDFIWNKMPRIMLAKVAEALGLRKAFPQDLSGIYTSEEMQQAEKTIIVEGEEVDTETGEVKEGQIMEDVHYPEEQINFELEATDKQIALIKKLSNSSNEKIQEAMEGIELGTLTKKEAGELITKLLSVKAKRIKKEPVKEETRNLNYDPNDDLGYMHAIEKEESEKVRSMTPRQVLAEAEMIFNG